ALTDANTGSVMRTLLTDKLVAALTAMDQQQCTLTINPAADNVEAGGQVALIAALTPALNPANLASVTYKWSITGDAGGSFTNPLTGAAVTSTLTTTPQVTYNASGTATAGQSDSIVVEEDVGTANNNNSTSKDLADTKNAPAVVTIGGLKVALSPANPTVNPASNTSFTASVTGDVPSGATYQWTLVGTGSIGISPVTTSTPTISYTAPTTAPISGSDTLAVVILSSAGEVLGKTSTAITTANNPWVGVWVGSTTSTCGFFSGALTLTITSTGTNTLHLDLGGGGYPLTIDPSNPLVAQYNNGEVIDTLSGPGLNTLTSVEPDACQSGTWTKQ
ncbi:MAG: hypothetical protein M3Y55_11610, partial [Pseudomonadota bacterium]|nr:hypothetical protein [Pseudomonadota bacterium]